VVATAALVLAIGLNTSLFTVFNGIALKPWPIPNPERAVVVFAENANGPAGGVSPVEYRSLRDQARSVRLVALSPFTSSLAQVLKTPPGPSASSVRTTSTCSASA
jgi:hypothetical protein